jgi:hypothetical protein
MAAGSGADTSGSGMGIPAIKGMSSGNTSGTGIPTIRGMGSMGSGITTTGTGSMVVCERCGKVIDVNAKDRKFVASLK